MMMGEARILGRQIMGKIGLALAATCAAVAAVPVQAAQFVVTFPSATAIQSNNDFQSNLAGEGLYWFASTGATLSLSGAGKVTFEYMASESGFFDSFTAGSVSGVETNNGWGAVLLGSAWFSGGAVTDWEFTSDQGLAAKVGDVGFGIFLPMLQQLTSSPYKSKVLYFGYDDQVSNPDDNHDDFIIRASITAVPEPATWAMLITGFGLVGMAARRRGIVRTSN